MGGCGGAGGEAGMLLETPVAEMVGSRGKQVAPPWSFGGTFWGEDNSLGKESSPAGIIWDAYPGGTG